MGKVRLSEGEEVCSCEHASNPQTSKHFRNLCQLCHLAYLKHTTLSGHSHYPDHLWPPMTLATDDIVADKVLVSLWGCIWLKVGM